MFVRKEKNKSFIQDFFVLLERLIFEWRLDHPNWQTFEHVVIICFFTTFVRETGIMYNRWAGGSVVSQVLRVKKIFLASLVN